MSRQKESCYTENDQSVKKSGGAGGTAATQSSRRTTAVVPARFVSHLRVANRLRRLCPLGTRFPPVPAGVIGAEPLTLVPQHFPRKPAQRCLRATAANLGFFDRLKGASRCREAPFLLDSKISSLFGPKDIPAHIDRETADSGPDRPDEQRAPDNGKIPRCQATRAGPDDRCSGRAR